MIGSTIWRRLGISIDEPCCAHCGYNVKGLPSFTCPECGTDLREGGILTPGRYSPNIKAISLRTWRRLRLGAKALAVALRAAGFAGYHAFRIVWRRGTRDPGGGPIRFVVSIGKDRTSSPPRT